MRWLLRYGYTNADAGRRFNVSGETVRLWAAGLAVPSVGQQRTLEAEIGIPARLWPKIRVGRPRKEVHDE